jgi:hypothetical protein
MLFCGAVKIKGEQSAGQGTIIQRRPAVCLFCLVKAFFHPQILKSTEVVSASHPFQMPGVCLYTVQSWNVTYCMHGVFLGSVESFVRARIENPSVLIVNIVKARA